MSGARYASLTILVMATAGLTGIGVVVRPQVSFAVAVLVLALAAVAAPTAGWVAVALVSAVTCKGLASLGILPSIATYLDLPLAWGAFALGLLRHRKRSRLTTRVVRWLAVLALAVLLAWAFNPSEVLRPLVDFMLLAEPFAIVGALLLDPPTPRIRRTLQRTALALVIVQIPFAFLELTKLGPADRVQGTLYGAGAGAHVMSAIVSVGGIWILAGGARGALPKPLSVPVLAALVVIPFVADAKQVIAALPAVVLATSWRGGRVAFFGRAVLAIGSVVVLFTVIPAGRSSDYFIHEARQGRGGKEAAAAFVWHELTADPSALVFGKGPAETVSRAAFMTTPNFQSSGFDNSKSPLAVLGLKPASIAIEAQQQALAESGGGTSLNTGVSSTLGVVGDLGFFGLFAYLGLLLTVFLRLRREASPDAVGAAAGFAMFIVLGLAFDWWEQPPFGVFLGVLAGLGLTEVRYRAPLAKPRTRRLTGIQPTWASTRPVTARDRRLSSDRSASVAPPRAILRTTNTVFGPPAGTSPRATRRLLVGSSTLRGARSLGYGLLAQVCSSATNFALVVVAGHVLGPLGLGTVFIGFSAYVILLGLERGLITDALVAGSAARGVAERQRSANAAITLCLVCGVPCAALFAVIGNALPVHYGFGLLVFAPWLVPALVQDLGRSIVFRDRDGPAVALSDGSWLALMVCAVPLAVHFGGGWAVVASWGVGGVAGALVALKQLHFRPVRLREAASCWKVEAWPLAKWLAAQTTIYSALTYATVLVLAAALGATDYGGLRAVQSVFAPLTLLAPAMALPGLPLVSRSFARAPARARRVSFAIAALLTGLTAAYVAILCLVPELLGFFFGSRFATFDDIVLPVGLGQVLIAPTFGLALFLKAARRGRALLWLGTLNAASYLVAAVVLAAPFGLNGAAWAGPVMGGLGVVGFTAMVYRRTELVPQAVLEVT